MEGLTCSQIYLLYEEHCDIEECWSMDCAYNDDIGCLSVFKDGSCIYQINAVCEEYKSLNDWKWHLMIGSGISVAQKRDEDPSAWYLRWSKEVGKRLGYKVEE